MAKTISVKLSKEGLDKAIKAVEEEKAALRIKAGAIAMKLAEEGAAKAKSEVERMDAIMHGDLVDSIRAKATGVSSSAIIADAAHAEFVEYGTGIKAKESGYKHPELPSGWKHDSNEHGEAGWWYWNEELYAFINTKGMESRPFMYNTKTWLKDNAAIIAKKELSRK